MFSVMFSLFLLPVQIVAALLKRKTHGRDTSDVDVVHKALSLIFDLSVILGQNIAFIQNIVLTIYHLKFRVESRYFVIL